MDSNSSKNKGDGENFVAFMEKELMPYIDSAYPVQPYRMLIGHSFGGLTVMNILTNHTKLFNEYIAIDPSMWYDKERFLKTTEQKLGQNNYKGIKLYCSCLSNRFRNKNEEWDLKQNQDCENNSSSAIFTNLPEVKYADPKDGEKLNGVVKSQKIVFTFCKEPA